MNVKQSATLMSGALLVTVMGVTEIANADPTDMLINTVSSGGTSPYSILHTFGTSTAYNLVGFTLVATSGVSDREGWQYEITWDLTAFDVSFFPATDTFNVFMDIKPPGQNDITSIQVKDHDGVVTENWVDLTGNGTGFSGGIINLGVSFSILQPTGSGNEFFTIQWNQGAVPAPGALALLGLAAVAGRRRRR